jgi:hypothetical protein
MRSDTTSKMPKSNRPFTKDTLEGEYKGYRREIWSTAAYDEMESKGAGNGCVNIYFALIKPDKEAIVFAVFTGWHLPQTLKRWEERGIAALSSNPQGGAVDFHWSDPQWEGQEMETSCLLIEGGECYGNTGFTIGKTVYDALLKGGFDAVWEVLYQYLRLQEQEKEEEE